MYQIGVDIVRISKIEKYLKNPAFLREVFTPQEQAHCKSAQNFAGIFAAKEAYFKALGTGIQRPICKVEILYKENGKPYIAADDCCDVSIAHDGEYAIATVIKW